MPENIFKLFLRKQVGKVNRFVNYIINYFAFLKQVMVEFILKKTSRKRRFLKQISFKKTTFRNIQKIKGA